MRIEFQAKTNKEYAMVNVAKFRLPDGTVLTVDRHETDYSINDGILDMEWSGCYLWSVNGLTLFDNECALLGDYAAEYLNRAECELELEDDADDDYEVTDVTFICSSMKNKIKIAEDISIIQGATLLSIEEAERFLTKEERAYRDWWWLRSPGGSQYNAATVLDDGSVRYFGHAVYNDDDCVRPALIINLKSSDLKIGDEFEFGGQEFRIISGSLAFCLGDIGRGCFRKGWKASDANVYEASDVKKIVDKWFHDTIYSNLLEVRNDEYYSDEVHCVECTNGFIGVSGWHKPLGKILEDIKNGTVSIENNPFNHNLHIVTDAEDYFAKTKTSIGCHR